MQLKSAHQVVYLDLVNMNNECTGGGFPGQSDLSEGNLWYYVKNFWYPEQIF